MIEKFIENTWNGVLSIFSSIRQFFKQRVISKFFRFGKLFCRSRVIHFWKVSWICSEKYPIEISGQLFQWLLKHVIRLFMLFLITIYLYQSLHFFIFLQERVMFFYIYEFFSDITWKLTDMSSNDYSKVFNIFFWNLGFFWNYKVFEVFYSCRVIYSFKKLLGSFSQVMTRRRNKSNGVPNLFSGNLSFFKRRNFSKIFRFLSFFTGSGS